MASPLEQFEVHALGPHIMVGGIDVSFSNSALFMVLAVGVSTLLLVRAMRPRALVPGRLQSLAEVTYEFVAGMVNDNAGRHAAPFFPFVFSLFMFILFGNLIGMIPGSFTFTSHIVVTFALALTVFIMVTVVALVRHGLHFFSFFLPQGAPLLLAPLLIPIEIISYLTRPVSLSIRLFANMMAGHTMMAVFGGFTVTLAAALGVAGYAVGVLPIVVNIMLTGFEILVAVLQAYVFSVLSCIYIHDALELH